MSPTSTTAGREGALSPQMFCWLLVPDSAPPAPPSSREQTRAIADVLLRMWQILPSTASRFLEWIPPAHRELVIIKRLAARAEATRIFARLQARCFETVAKAYNAAGFPYAALKSSALRYAIWSSPDQRCGEDLDLAVGRAHLGAAQRVLEALGFSPAQWNERKLRYEHADPALRRAVEARHYELGFIVRRDRIRGLTAEQRAAIYAQLDIRPWVWHVCADGALATYQMVDVHHSLTLGMPAEPLIETRRALDARGTPCWAPSPAWSAFYIIYKLYWEGAHHYGEGAHQYADLVRLAPMLTADDVAILRAVVMQRNLAAAAWYVLRRLPTDFGVAISPALQALLDECRRPELSQGCFEQNDYGDMWMKLWGMR